MEKIKGLLLDIDYITKDGKALVRLFLKNGKNLIAVDDSFLPYLYAICKHDPRDLIKEIKRIGLEGDIKVNDILVETRNLLGEKQTVLRVVLQHPQDVPKIRTLIRSLKGVEDVFEHDLPFVRRYLIDKGVTPTAMIEVEGKKNEYFEIEKVSPIDEPLYRPLTTMAFDIEVYNPKGAPREEKDPITMVSLASNTGLRKVLTWRGAEGMQDFVEVLESEADVLKRFAEVVEDEDVDILIGYNTDQFDFPYIETRRKKLGLKLPLGRDHSEVKFKTAMGIKKAIVRGRPHVDLYPIVRRSVRLSSYVLENVVLEVLGREKEKIPGEVMWRHWDEGGDKLKKLIEYSMEDATVTLELGENFLPLYLELSRIVKMPLFDVARMTSGQLVEWLLIREAFERKELVPNRALGGEFARRAMATYAGGYVLEPKKGLIEDIAVFDFRSLYPSVIVTHNIDPTTFSIGRCENSPPDFDYCFSEEKKGFIPTILENLIEHRKKVKERMKGTKDDVELKMSDVQQNALKILANSFYGYMGYPRARWYKKECAESVTSFARKYIKGVMEEAAKYGFEVVYGDTDSLFIVVPKDKKEIALDFMNETNEKLPGTIKLEYEGFYKRGIFVTKKRYALIDDENKITIKGLEFVRRDWAPITRKTQERVLEAILEHGSPEKAAEIVKETIKSLRKREVSIEDVTLYTQLTKKIESYKSKGPHVHAAEKLRRRGIEVRPGNVVRYIITKGTKMISERAEPVDFVTIDDYDAEYYIEHQILPTASRILESFGYSEVDLKGGIKQESLAQWFE